MDADIYLQGFLVTTALLVIEHLTLYTPLRLRKDAGDGWRVLLKFILGILAILAGCARVAWQADEPLALLAPAACAMGGLVIAAGYVGRWLFARATKSAYIRGRLHGLADHADIAAEERDGR